MYKKFKGIEFETFEMKNLSIFIFLMKNFKIDDIMQINIKNKLCRWHLHNQKEGTIHEQRCNKNGDIC